MFGLDSNRLIQQRQYDLLALGMDQSTEKEYVLNIHKLYTDIPTLL